jgi:hypothetical protein
MIARKFTHQPLWRAICVVLSLMMASGPSAAIAQTSAAQQAVRQRVQGLEGRPDGPPSPEAEAERAADDPTLPADASAGKLDLTFVTPGAVAIAVVRPAQIMAAPMAEMLPTEIATAAGLAYLGIDPATVEEVIAFADMSNPAAPAYGVTVHFNQPFRGSAIPPHARPFVQLSELAGRKYLQSAHPIWPSFYGTTNQTLIVAPDATLRQLVESMGQAKSGPLFERAGEAPAGNDLYLAVDVASLRPLIQMGIAQAASQLPPEAQSYLKLPDLIAAAEFTLNLSEAGPTSLVVHAADEASAQELESLVLDAVNQYQEKMRAQYAEQAGSGDPVQQALAQYMERVSARSIEQLRPSRDGARLTFFHPEAQDPSQNQFMQVAGMGIAAGLLMPAIQAARNAARQAQVSEPSEPPTETEAAP